MGMAYAYKKGELKDADVSAEVKELADSMTLKQLKDFASTKHDGLPEVAENITPAAMGGVGPVVLPMAGQVGSGDVPAGRGDAEEEYKKKKRKMKHLKTFESFVNEAYSEDDINMSYGFYGQIEANFDEKKAKKLFDQGVKDLQKKYKLTEEEALGVLNSKMGRKAADQIYDEQAKTAIEGLETYYGKSLHKEIANVQRSLVYEEVSEAMDFNDPVLIAMRAAKQDFAAKKAQAALDRKRRVYGKQRDALEDQLWEISMDLKDLTRERSQLYSDMENEAGQMGAEWSDNDANRYGEELNRVESKIEQLKAKRSEIETRLSY